MFAFDKSKLSNEVVQAHISSGADSVARPVQLRATDISLERWCIDHSQLDSAPSALNSRSAQQTRTEGKAGAPGPTGSGPAVVARPRQLSPAHDSRTRRVQAVGWKQGASSRIGAGCKQWGLERADLLACCGVGITACCNHAKARGAEACGVRPRFRHALVCASPRLGQLWPLYTGKTAPEDSDYSAVQP
jgi:hypothetical protein